MGKERGSVSFGMIFNIQRFSIYDGPGARTTVFFKGCNLRCKWCHNPESIPSKPQLEFYPDRCIGCGKCLEVCPTGAQGVDAEGAHVIDREACVNCMKCVDTCYAEALVAVGQRISAEELMEAVMTDVPYYQRSGGGVTFTGGECMVQHDFLKEMLRRLKAEGIHTAVDTAGNVPWRLFEEILADTDIFLYDVKAADPEVHRRLTGVENGLILENLRRLCAAGKRIWIRIPYIPGCNDKEMPAIAALLEGLPVERVEVMPYHRLGEGKYAALGLENTGPICVIPTDAEIERVVEMLKQRNLPAYRS